MIGALELGISLKLYDQFSGGIGRAASAVEGLAAKSRAMSEAFGRTGRGLLAQSSFAVAAIQSPVAAFADLEDASLRLKSTMLQSDGSTGLFGQVNDMAVKLGNVMPGTTADFLNMAAALKSQGISDDSILGGVGAATANLAVLMKQAPADMAIGVAKLKTRMGIADQDMLKFMDTIQRTYFLGVQTTEMMHGLGKAGMSLKTIGMQGLDVGNAVAPLMAMAIRNNMTGETAGTAFGSIVKQMVDSKKMAAANRSLKGEGIEPLKFTDIKGNFAGFENMVAQLDKLKGLKAEKLTAVIKDMFGTGDDGGLAAVIVKEGMAGYQKMIADMKAQADLQTRVNIQLGSLRNVWDAASGTFVNALAFIGQSMGDDLKLLAGWFGNLSAGMSKFAQEFPSYSKWISRGAMVFIGITAVGGGLALAMSGLLKIATPLIGVFTKLWGAGNKSAVANSMSMANAQKVFVINWPPSMGGAGMVGGKKMVGGRAGMVGGGEGMVGGKKMVGGGEGMVGGGMADAMANSPSGKLGKMARMKNAVLNKGSLIGTGAVIAGGLAVNQFTTEGSTANKIGNTAVGYGSAALMGGQMGAMVGSIVPGLGTAIGGAVGAGLGLAFKGISDYMESRAAAEKNQATNNKMAGGGERGKVDVKISVDQDGKVNRVHTRSAEEAMAYDGLAMGYM
ncbi:MAG: phage tail tape measure protein [Candidatus Pacebacteria bacterium]|nr:phage tail tape measure protein [Candidatus Paceibacterota bacterium]